MDTDRFMFDSENKFNPPPSFLQIQCIDMHTEGEPLRVIVGGFPKLPGKHILEKRRYCEENYDHLRRAVMLEPRGHADMYGCIISEPNDAQAHFGVLFIHNDGFSTMCGHAVIALAKLAVDMGWVQMEGEETEVVIDAPCGRIFAYTRMRGGQVTSSRFHCVPSYVVALDQKIDIPGVGRISYDIAYGGSLLRLC